MEDDIIKIKRREASLNLFESQSVIPVTDLESSIDNPVNIKLLNYQDLLNYIKITSISHGNYFKYSYDNNGCKVTLFMRSIKSIADYLFRYYNDTNVYCIQSKQTNLLIKN